MSETLTKWFRTCQECGYVTEKFKEPVGKPTDGYMNAKCPHCKSMAFDFGSRSDPTKPLEDFTA